MADFHPILARAVAGLPDKSPQARQAVYDRARTALVTQLRSLDPPLGEAEIMRERLSLDEAVGKVEAEFDDAPAPVAVAEPAVRPVPEAPAATPEPAPPESAPPEPAGEPFADPAPEPPQNRPRVQPPRQRGVDPGHIRTAVVGGGVAVAVAAIAAAAFYVNKIKPPEAPARPRTETAAPQTPADNAGKLGDRVGEAGTPAQPQRPAGTGAQNPPVQNEVAVAQRAILYAEVPENPQQPRAIVGRVFWRLDSESAGQGRPVETIVRATVEVPEAALTLDFTIRRNTESAFPASHIIGLRFGQSGAQVPEAIREVGVPQLKTEEGERGAPLSAINSALGDNLFVVALSNVPVEVERNIELMTARNWIDVPIRFASGRRGIITFEKGFSGNQTLTDALQRWR
jgi:hypothetical protein